MTDSLDDAEFWLPSQFLSDDDWLIEKEYMKTVSNDRKGFITTKDVFGGPYEDLSSPVEESASTETESDEDDYSFLLAGLTHQMARSSLQADDRSSKGWPSKLVSMSPRCQFGNCCGCKPVATPQATWDLLYAAAGEIAKMNLDEEAASHVSSGGPLLGHTRSYFAPNRRATHTPAEIALFHKLQALQLRQQQQQLLKRQQQQGMALGVQGGSHLYLDHPSYRGRTTLNGFRPGQVLQQQKHSGSGMQPVFLGNQPAKRERNGTGVFLPRRAGIPAADTRKKSGGSTVLLPERVIQSLNLMYDVSGSQHAHSRHSAYNDDGDLRVSSLDFLDGSHGNQNSKSHSPVASREVGLPQEWTY